jgi:hypothetical protein
LELRIEKNRTASEQLHFTCRISAVANNENEITFLTPSDDVKQSAIIGGSGNTVNSFMSVIVGGENNTGSGARSVV